MAKKAKKGGALRVYKSYLFTNKDPVIDEVRTMVKDTFGEVNRRSLKAIEESGGPSAGAMSGWFFRNIKKPQSATVEAAGRAMGYKRTWTKMKK